MSENITNNHDTREGANDSINQINLKFIMCLLNL